MKRKILSTIAIMLAMSLMLTACGGKTETETSVSGNTSEIAEEEISETNEETEEKEETEETEEPTEEVKPTEEPAPSEEPVHTHTWSQATCTSPKTCSGCGETSGSALGHSFSNGKCSRCGAKDPNYQEPTPPAHTHSYTSKVTTEATCTSNGTITYTCSCGHSYTESTSALGHNYQDHEETIHHPGESRHIQVCYDCGFSGSSSEVGDHLYETGHTGSYGDTISTPGWDEIIHKWICSRCGHCK